MEGKMLLVKNGKILTMAGKNYENGYVLADKGKILKTGSDLTEIYDIISGLEDVKVIDAAGGFVLPGFIDAHCHVGLWEDSIGFEGEDGNEMTDPVTPHLRAIDGIYFSDRSFIEARENGVTTVVTGPGSANVIGGQFAAIKTFGNRIEEMIIKEPVAMKVAFGENPKTVYSEKKQAPMTRMATAAILRENTNTLSASLLGVLSLDKPGFLLSSSSCISWAVIFIPGGTPSTIVIKPPCKPSVMPCFFLNPPEYDSPEVVILKTLPNVLPVNIYQLQSSAA
jgi:imidazolonepropionase-like amidohydrolase